MGRFLPHARIHLTYGFPVLFSSLNAVPVHEVINYIGNLYIMIKELMKLVEERSLKKFLTGGEQSGTPFIRKIVEGSSIDAFE